MTMIARFFTQLMVCENERISFQMRRYPEHFDEYVQLRVVRNMVYVYLT